MRAFHLAWTHEVLSQAARKPEIALWVGMPGGTLSVRYEITGTDSGIIATDRIGLNPAPWRNQNMNAGPHIPIDREKIAQFCRKWRITEFALFGSVLREDFRPDSDVDVLVRFEPEAPWSLLDLVTMTDELKGVLDREVDLVEREAVERSENYIRRHEILSTAEPVYVAG